MLRMFVALLALVSTALPAAQALQDQPLTWITISQGAGDARLSASVGLERTAFYSAGPWAGVPARRIEIGRETTATEFRIRAWKESDIARVAVYAVSVGAEGQESEILVSLLGLRPGESREVEQTEQYGAARVTVSAHNR
jgi:hypothetical protein